MEQGQMRLSWPNFKVLTEPPPDPRASDRGIGAELSVVLGKALEKEPKNRFATAEELAEELRRIRQHEPIRSRRPSVLLRSLRWCPTAPPGPTKTIRVSTGCSKR